MPVLDNLSYAGNWKPQWGNWKNTPWQQMTPQQQAARVADDNAWKRDHGLLPQSHPGGGAPSFGFEAPSMGGGSFPELFQPDKFPRSYSGLPKAQRDKIAGDLTPMLIEKAKALPETIDKYTSNAANLYQNLTRQALSDAMPGVLNNLISRRMLNSSVASDAIQNLGRQAVPFYSDKAYQAAMEGAKMHANVPGVLGNLVNLARYSDQTNELAPYQMLASFVAGF